MRTGNVPLRSYFLPKETDLICRYLGPWVDRLDLYGRPSGREATEAQLRMPMALYGSEEPLEIAVDIIAIEFNGLLQTRIPDEKTIQEYADRVEAALKRA